MAHKITNKLYFSAWDIITGEPRRDNRIQLIIYHHFLSSKYPDLKPILLYVNRKEPDQIIEIPVEYSDDEV